MTILEQIFKVAKKEAEFIQYYGYGPSREEETFEDIKFYDRMLPIGYSKVYTALHIKCCMGYVNTLNLKEVKEIVYGPRNHENNIYSCLEFVIHNKINGYLDLIKFIKK